MGRRAWGSGSLYQRKSDGRWVGSVRNTRGRREYVTGTDPDEVSSRLLTLRNEGRSSTSPAGDTLAVFLERWLAEIAPPKIRARTLAGYRRIARLHVVPAIGHIALDDLEAADAQGMVTWVLSRRSPQTARNALGVIRSALSDAVRFGVVEANVAKMVRQPRVPRPTLRPYALEEASSLIELTSEEADHALYVLAVTTGMRIGELQALRWVDVDLKRRTATVNASLRRLDEKRWIRDEPKTARSRRTLPLTGAAIAALKHHKSTWSRSAKLVFTRHDGRPEDPTAILRRFQASCARHGLRRVTLHSLRHTAATLMLEGSHGDLRMVQSVLGHANITTTVDLYGGLAEEPRQRAANVMDSLLPASAG